MSTRRQFLQQSIVLAAGAAIASRSPLFASTSAPNVQFPTAPRERIAVSSYPFRDFIGAPGAPSANGGTPKIALQDFAAHVESKFNVNKVELWSGHFPSTDDAYLHTLRDTVRAGNGAIVNLAVDGEHSPYSQNSDEREKAIAFSQHWIDIAALVGSPSVRTNIPDDHGMTPDLDRTAASLRRVADYAASRNVVVHLENDNPVSEDPMFLVKLIGSVNSPWLHALPDFANSLATGAPEKAYAGVNAMFAHAYGICHVKEVELTPSGKPVHVDMFRTFQYLKQNHFRGYCSMEFDSPGDPYAGTSALIEQTLQHLS